MFADATVSNGFVILVTVAILLDVLVLTRPINTCEGVILRERPPLPRPKDLACSTGIAVVRAKSFAPPQIPRGSAQDDAVGMFKWIRDPSDPEPEDRERGTRSKSR